MAKTNIKLQCIMGSDFICSFDVQPLERYVIHCNVGDWILLLSGYKFLKIEQEHTVCM